MPMGELNAPNRASSSHARVPELDGIRAIAIWMVLLTHALFGFRNSAGALDQLPRPLLLVLDHGWLGVDLFFLLSGFLITGILLDSKERPHYFRNFYIRRALRILPLYLAVVLIWSAFYRGAGSYFLLSSVFAANLSALLQVPSPHGPGVLWSLAVEEHFYFLWPLIVFLLPRRGLLAISGAIFLVTPLLRGVFASQGMNPDVIYMLSWFRFDGLAGGAMLALWVRSGAADRRQARWLAGILVISFLLLSLVGAGYGLMAGRSTVGVALRYTQFYLLFGAGFVLAVAYRGTRWTAPLRWRFMQLTGLLSYALYLIHLSIGDAYESLLATWGFVGSDRFGPTGAVVLRAAVMITVSFAVAWVANRAIEAPFLALKDRFTGGRRAHTRAHASVVTGDARS